MPKQINYVQKISCEIQKIFPAVNFVKNFLAVPLPDIFQPVAHFLKQKGS